MDELLLFSLFIKFPSSSEQERNPTRYKFRIWKEEDMTSTSGVLRTLGKESKNIFANVQCVLIDLSGTLHVGDTPTDNAAEGLQR